MCEIFSSHFPFYSLQELVENIKKILSPSHSLCLFRQTPCAFRPSFMVFSHTIKIHAYLQVYSVTARRRDRNFEFRKQKNMEWKNKILNFSKMVVVSTIHCLYSNPLVFFIWPWQHHFWSFVRQCFVAMETFHYEYTQPGWYWDGPSLHVTATWFMFFVEVMKSLSKGRTHFWALSSCYINPPINLHHIIKFLLRIW